MNLTLPEDVAGTVAKTLAMGSSFDVKSMSARERMELQCQWYNQTRGSLTEVDCPECKNKGDIAVARYDETFRTWNEVHIPCRCHETRRLVRRLKASGLPASCLGYSFDGFRTDEPWQKTLKDKAMAFEDGWFYLGGQSGCGKTHLCTAILKKLLEKGRSGRYMLWRDEAVRLKASVNEGYDGRMDRLKQADVLYIDDLFKTGRAGDAPQQPTPADINLAFELLNFRASSNRTTILSSECTIDSLIAIDEALGGRVAEKAGAFCLSVRRDRSRNYRLRGVTEL